MTKYGFTLILLAGILHLAACGGEAKPVTEDTVSDIYTAFFETITAQANTVLLAITPTVVPATTSIASPTFLTATFVYPTATLYTSSYAYGCYDSAFVSDVSISDGTWVAPDEEFVKTWKLLNSGSCSWSSNYSLAFLSGTRMGGDATVLGEAVAPGDTIKISIALAAPEAEGSYTGYWIMMDSIGAAFGTSVYVQIVVTEDAVTETATPADTEVATEVAENTPTSTPTPTSTEMPVPTETSTPEGDDTGGST